VEVLSNWSNSDSDYIYSKYSTKHIGKFTSPQLDWLQVVLSANCTVSVLQSVRIS